MAGHLGERAPGAEFEKGACTCLDATLKAIGPLNGMRYLGRQLVESFADIDDWSAIDPAQQAHARGEGRPDGGLRQPGTKSGGRLGEQTCVRGDVDRQFDDARSIQ